MVGLDGVIAGGLDTANLWISISLVIGLLGASRFLHILDGPGSAAAAVVGLIVGLFGHWSWLIILLAFLATSHYATKWRWEDKKERGLCESEDGHRGWYNVAANGTLPAAVALVAFYQGSWTDLHWIFAAGVAVAASDTWASEFGCLDDRVRMITTMKKCEAGVNGGFSPNGQLAALGGAAMIAFLGALFWFLMGIESIDHALLFAGYTTAIGWLGCQVDSVFGAVLENRGLMTKGMVNAASITSGMAAMFWLLRL